VPYYLIVDGQQRLTSLYAVTTGKPVVRVAIAAVAWRGFSSADVRPGADPREGPAQPSWSYR
jgi:hypothetical protein